MAAAAVLIALCVAVPLMTSSVPEGVSAAVELTDETGSGATREAQATVRVSPAGAAEDAKWLTITAWQGGGLHVDRLERVSDGVYRTTEPMPIGGDWKTLVRLHNGTDLTAAAVYLPEDPAIPAKEIPAQASFERPFVAEIDLLQRERKDDQPAWLWAGASAIVLALYLAFFGALAWGVGRISRRWDDDVPSPPASSGTDTESQRAERFTPAPARVAPNGLVN
jgi:hypothetical protein